MRSTLIAKVGSLALVAALAANAGIAHAQDEPATDDIAETNSSDDEIVVTAQFRGQRLQDTPIAITAVTGETLEARNQTSIVDLGAFAPNVNLSQATAINANAVAAFIRGVGQEDASFALEPGVGIYIDDVYYGTTFGAVMELADLDRVEVLRGPQGTLAGKNSLGGAVKLFSKRPNATDGGYVQASYGRFNRLDLRGSANFAITDELFARFSGIHSQRDGFLKVLDFGCANPGGGIPATTTGNCVTGTLGGTDVTALRGALRYAPADSDIEINLIADIARNDAENVPTKTVVADRSLVAPPLSLAENRTYDPNIIGGVPFDGRFLTGPGDYTTYENFIGAGNFTTIFGTPYQVTPGTFPDNPTNTANSHGIAAIVDVGLTENLSVKSITAWRKAYGTSTIEIDGTPITLLKQRLNNTHEQFTQELRLSGTFGTLVDFTVGGFYYTANDRGDYRVMIPVFLYDFLADDRSDNESVAAFAHVELHLTDALNVIGGLRYTDDKKEYTFSRLNADGSTISGIPLTPNFLVAGLSGLSGTFADDRVDYRLGANYRFSDGLMAYAQVATGYKGGGVNPRPFVADQVQPFGPETLTTYEAGFKADLLGRLLRLNGAVFYNEYSDIQRQIYICPTSASLTCAQTLNAGDGHSQGAELELFARPVEGLTIDGSLGYLDFDYDSVNPLSLVTLDMVAPFHSKWTASAGVQYEADLGNSGRITPRVDVSYQSDFYYNAVNNPFNLIDGRTLVNARLAYETADGDWEISANVTNLFDRFYYVGASENIANFGLANSVVGRPREWSLAVRRNF